MKVVPSGFAVTKKYLTVGLRIDNAGAVRFAEVKVPIKDLADAEVQLVIEDFIAGHLRETWERGQQMLPLEKWE